MLATSHLMASQYRTNWIRIERALMYWFPVRPRQIESTIAPKYHGRRVTAVPVKLRFGRPGTWMQETIHLQYMTKTHGNGMTNRAPMKNTTERQVNCQIPKSIESDPLPEPPALTGSPPE